MDNSHDSNKPVAWVEGEVIYWHNAPDLNDWIRQNGHPLYTSPQTQRKPLTKVEVDSWDLPDHPTVFEFAQFVEAKLKEKNT